MRLSCMRLHGISSFISRMTALLNAMYTPPLTKSQQNDINIVTIDEALDYCDYR